MKVGVVAPSGVVPELALQRGVCKIQEAGFQVDIHPQCQEQHLFFAGTDTVRAQAFWEYANHPDYAVIWCARGGHGCLRLLPILEQWSQQHGKPAPKLLVGYSDITVLMNYVHQQWGWSILHAPMPSHEHFSDLPEEDLLVLWDWLLKKTSQARWELKPLTYWTPPPQRALQAMLLGGNLTLWTCLTGTSFQQKKRNYFLFLEDVGESLYRIDRLLVQLALSDQMAQVQAVILGNFFNCLDPVPKTLVTTRQPMQAMEGLQRIFTEWGEHLKIPIAYGLPVGHGPDQAPLPLGAEYCLTPQGYLSLAHWEWLDEGEFHLASGEGV